jgi:hypothetical protein
MTSSCQWKNDLTHGIRAPTFLASHQKISIHLALLVRFVTLARRGKANLGGDHLAVHTFHRNTMHKSVILLSVQYPKFRDALTVCLPEQLIKNHLSFLKDLLPL